MFELKAAELIYAKPLKSPEMQKSKKITNKKIK